MRNVRESGVEREEGKAHDSGRGETLSEGGDFKRRRQRESATERDAGSGVFQAAPGERCGWGDARDVRHSDGARHISVAPRVRAG